MGNNIILNDRDTGGYEAITVTNAAIGFSKAKISPTSGLFSGMDCREVFCTLETDSVRFTIDGSTTPTDAIGHLLTSGQNLTLRSVNDIKNFRCIRVTTDAALKVSYKF